MSNLYIVAGVLYILLLLSLITVILMQKKRTTGTANAAGIGNSDTYWGKNKKRTMESKLESLTKILGVLFFISSFALCLL